MAAAIHLRRSRTPIPISAVFLTVLTFLASVALRADESVSLAWDPSPDASVTGYVLHYGPTSGGYTTNLNVGTNISATVGGLKEGATNYFVVTACNSQQVESEPSNEVCFIVPGIIRLLNSSSGGPQQLMFPVAPGQSYELQASSNLVNWISIFQTISPTNCLVVCTDSVPTIQKRFYRVHRLP